MINLNNSICKNSPENKRKEESLNNNHLNLYKLLENNIISRKAIEANGFEVFKLIYCCCCKKNSKEIITNKVIEYVEECSEFGNIIKLHSEVDILKKVLLNKDQQEAFVLPSLNLRFNSNLDKIGDNEDTNEEKESFTDKLNIAYISLNNLDLKRKENRILAENIVSSIM